MTFNGNLAKLTWSYATNIKNSITTFYICCYSCQSLKVSKRSVSRWSYDKHSNFFWDDVTWCDLVTWPWVIWVWIFDTICRNDVWTGVTKAKTCLHVGRDTGGGSNTAPGPAPVQKRSTWQCTQERRMLLVFLGNNTYRVKMVLQET